jgi:hypothetical protein
VSPASCAVGELGVGVITDPDLTWPVKEEGSSLGPGPAKGHAVHSLCLCV